MITRATPYYFRQIQKMESFTEYGTKKYGWDRVVVMDEYGWVLVTLYS